ncbi:hypothetical protein SARC_14315, partial [Sphaeroforma arctica JP610]
SKSQEDDKPRDKDGKSGEQFSRLKYLFTSGGSGTSGVGNGANTTGRTANTTSRITNTTSGNTNTAPSHSQGSDSYSTKHTDSGLYTTRDNHTVPNTRGSWGRTGDVGMGILSEPRAERSHNVANLDYQLGGMVFGDVKSSAMGDGDGGAAVGYSGNGNDRGSDRNARDYIPDYRSSGDHPEFGRSYNRSNSGYSNANSTHTGSTSNNGNDILNSSSAYTPGSGAFANKGIGVRRASSTHGRSNVPQASRDTPRRSSMQIPVLSAVAETVAQQTPHGARVGGGTGASAYSATSPTRGGKLDPTAARTDDIDSPTNTNPDMSTNTTPNINMNANTNANANAYASASGNVGGATRDERSSNYSRSVPNATAAPRPTILHMSLFMNGQIPSGVTVNEVAE